MVVDDEKDIVDLVANHLKRNGFDAIVLTDPLAALEDYKAHASKYALVITDIRMPGMNGFELARKIWDRDPYARICFLTAYEHYGEDAKWAVPGDKSLCFMVKPKSPSEVVGHLKGHGITPDRKSKDAKSRC